LVQYQPSINEILIGTQSWPFLDVSWQRPPRGGEIIKVVLRLKIPQFVKRNPFTNKVTFLLIFPLEAVSLDITHWFCVP
jgi:hypothetical protein